MQMVLITDPALAMHVLYSRHFDKFRFAYSFLDPVSLFFLDLIDSACPQSRSNVLPLEVLSKLSS